METLLPPARLASDLASTAFPLSRPRLPIAARRPPFRTPQMSTTPNREPAPPLPQGGGGRGGSSGAPESDDVVVQYVVLRRDLIDSWPLGSVVTQGCHASVAAVWAHRDHPAVRAYCSDGNLDSMHKVTLEVKGEAQLRNLSEKLKTEGIEHKLWIEQPENFPTCLATRPYDKSQVASFFKKLKLCK